MRPSGLWTILFSREHLEEHFFEKVKTKSSVGLDKISPLNFEEHLDTEIGVIERKVKNGTYNFTRYRELLFLKGAKKEPRIVSIPTVRDKLVTSVLNELVTEVFGEQSTSPLPQVLMANVIAEIQNYDFYLKIDISKFYASINQEKLLRIIRRKIRKKEILSLIQKAIQTETIAIPIKEKRERQNRQEGIPEGLPISNALANIYMSDIDIKYKNMPNIKYYRYVDDILIFLKKSDYSDVKQNIVRDITRLKLSINPDKVENGNTDNPFSYLGYYVSDSLVTVRKSGIYRLEASIEEIIKSCAKNNLKYLEWKLNLKITGFILDDRKYGWIFFYSQITDLSVLHHLDWFVEKILKKYNLVSKIRVKKFLRTYYEITKRLHKTNYIPDLNRLTIEEKKQLIVEIYGQEVTNAEDSKIEYLFRKIMKREIQDIEKDVEHIS